MTNKEDAQRYPLSWPHGWKRTPDRERKRSRFKLHGSSFAVVRDELLAELERNTKPMYRKNVVISTNIALRRDGLPYANQRQPEDPGVACYWMSSRGSMAIACDSYPRVWENMRAITKTLDALRGIERWGASELLDRAFAGFQALPDPSVEKPWWEVLGVAHNASLDAVRRRYRNLANIHHPDHGGEPERFRQIRQAYETAIGKTP